MTELDRAPVSETEVESDAEATTYLPRRIMFDLNFSSQEQMALRKICQAGDLSPQQALAHIVRARLLARPQFERFDRGRLRVCMGLLRLVEQHIGRAVRAAAKGQTEEVVNSRIDELLELATDLRRVGYGLGEALLGNLQYWQAGSAEPADGSDGLHPASAGVDAVPQSWSPPKGRQDQTGLV
ncbi:MAG: hypothetical protein E8A12_19165 [Phenylobacterium sp.]|nr:MAG: hypothetical protein E8A12_19165 [Phenylobacterium sp.]